MNPLDLLKLISPGPACNSGHSLLRLVEMGQTCLLIVHYPLLLDKGCFMRLNKTIKLVEWCWMVWIMLDEVLLGPNFSFNVVQHFGLRDPNDILAWRNHAASRHLVETCLMVVHTFQYYNIHINSTTSKSVQIIFDNV